MERIAVVGTGIMGRGIVANFLKAGKSVVVWNRTPEKAKNLGAKLVETPRDAANNADLIIEVTADDESSRDVWLGEDGILAGSKAGHILVTCATLSAKWTDELAQKCSSRNLIFFDMPMTGGRPAAESGNLTLLVGGNKKKLAEFEPDLGEISQTVRYFGEAGSGMRYKLVLQVLQAIHIGGFAEAMQLAKNSDLEEISVGEALAERPGGLTTTNFAWPGYQQQPNPINFSVKWISKDLKYAKEMAVGENYPLLETMIQRYEDAVDSGKGDADWTVITRPPT